VVIADGNTLGNALLNALVGGVIAVLYLGVYCLGGERPVTGADS